MARVGGREKFDVLLELELSSRELRRKRGDIICVVSESLPITAIQVSPKHPIFV